MGNDTEIRLRADRIFVRYLCEVTGMSASALATGANMASTTLNRFVGKKTKPGSTLKDSTVEKIAKKWGLDYLALITYRKKIEEALLEGRPPPDMNKLPKSASRKGEFKESPFHPFVAPERDPLMDKIMGATYEAWFHSPLRDAVKFDHLPDIVRLLYTRAKAEPKAPVVSEIKKRVTDMLSVMAMKGK